MNQIIEQNREKIKALCKKHFVKKLYPFGSALTDAFNPDSDIDFFYEIRNEEKPGFDYTGNLFSLEDELNLLLGRKVDFIKHDVNHLLIRTVGDKKVLLYAE